MRTASHGTSLPIGTEDRDGAPRGAGTTMHILCDRTRLDIVSRVTGMTPWPCSGMR
jgi:hypothetical protein